MTELVEVLEKQEEEKPKKENKSKFIRVSGFRVWQGKRYILVKSDNNKIYKLYTDEVKKVYMLSDKEVKELENA